MKKPLVTCVIPCYNESRWLGECITSLKRQTYPNVEILVVDDISTDDSAAKSRKLGARVVTLKKKGYEGGAREAGFREAKGEIIIQTDADAYFAENYVEEMTKPIIRGECDATAISLIRIHKARKGVLADFWAIKRLASHELKKRGKYEVKGALAFRKGIYEKVGSYKRWKVGADVDFANRVKKAGFKIKPVFTTCFYHADPDSLRAFAKRVYWGSFWGHEFMKKWGKNVFAKTLLSFAENIFFFFSAASVIMFLISGQSLFLAPIVASFIIEGVAPLALHKQYRALVPLAVREKKYKLALMLPLVMYLYMRLNVLGWSRGFFRVMREP